MKRSAFSAQKRVISWLIAAAVLLAMVPMPHHHHQAKTSHKQHDDETHTNDACHNIVFHGAQNHEECPHPAHLSLDEHECEICAHFSAQKIWIGIAIKSNFENSFLTNRTDETPLNFFLLEKLTRFLRGPPALV